MFAQSEVTEAAIKAAEKAAEHSWEALCIVVVLFAAMSLLGIIAKILLSNVFTTQKQHTEEGQKREEILLLRVSTLETFVQTKLLESLEECVNTLNKATTSNEQKIQTLNGVTETLAKLSSTMEDFTQRLASRNCLLGEEQQGNLIEAVASKVHNSVKSKLRQQ